MLEGEGVEVGCPCCPDTFNCAYEAKGAPGVLTVVQAELSRPV